MNNFARGLPTKETTKKQRGKKKRLSLYKINPDAAVSAFLDVNPEHMKKIRESSGKLEGEPNHGKVPTGDN